MTKEFCDYCNREIINREKMRIDFTGSIKESGMIYDHILLCKKCYKDTRQKIDRIIFNKTSTKEKSLSKKSN